MLSLTLISDNGNSPTPFCPLPQKKRTLYRRSQGSKLCITVQHSGWTVQRSRILRVPFGMESSDHQVHKVAASNDEVHLTMRGISTAKVMARRARRHSLFIPKKSDDDIGISVLAHADFPQPRPRSLSSLDKTQREPGFDKEIAHKIMDEVMSQELAYKAYDLKECSSLSQGIVDGIRSRVSSTFSLSGFKLLCTCNITKRARNSMHMESGCAWDETKSSILKDSFVDCVFKNSDIVAICTVYCVYCKKVTKPTLSAPEAAFPTKPARRCTISEPPRRQELEDKWLEARPEKRRAFTNE